MSFRPIESTTIIAALLACGCYCTAEARSSDYDVLLVGSSPADSTGATFSLNQYRGSTKQELWGWFIDVRSTSDSVIEARIVDPGAPSGERVLGVLSRGYYPYRGIYRSYGADPYTGRIPYEEFWDRVAGGGIELEVRLESGATISGTLVQYQQTGWADFCTS
jgi:hypothetical protein